LNILEAHDLRALGHNSAAYLHPVIEAKRIAYADRDAYLADPAAVLRDTLTTLLAKSRVGPDARNRSRARAAAAYAPATLNRNQEARAGARVDGRDRGDTVYLTAADDRGHVVSFIQSIFDNFGAGIVAGETGIVLHNRASLFTRQPGHPNAIGPHKRPFHTLVPAMVFKNGRPWWSFGVMGGDLQAQAHAQVIANAIDFGMHVQEAGEAARIRHSPGGVALEDAIGSEVRAALTGAGHRVIDSRGVFGGYQGIMIDAETGVLMGGSDPRKDGLAIGW
jgi:gamma-glutamyltranspeptidase/glutathione hydrolase